MASGSIDTVQLKIACTPSGCLNTVAIKIYTHTPSGCIIIEIPGNINPHAQWLSQNLRPVAVPLLMPSDNINTVPEIINS